LSCVGFWVPEPCFGDVFCGVVAEVDDVEDAGPEPEPEPEPFFGFGVVEVEVEAEVGAGVEVVCAGVVAVTVAAGVVAVTCGHDHATLVTDTPGGSGSELTGVPCATFWKVKV
jgi:hypothetical protein